MENADTNVNDVLLLFKTKVQEAIYLIEDMPDDSRRDVWQFWKEVSKIVKTTTRPRPTKPKRKTLRIKSEPNTEEIELSILHLEESVDNQDENEYNDEPGTINLPTEFMQDLGGQTPVDNKTSSFSSTSGFQNSHSSVKNETNKLVSEMVSSSNTSSKVVNSSFSVSSIAPVSSSGVVSSLVRSSTTVSPAVNSSNSTSAQECSSEVVGASTSHIVFEDLSTLVPDTKPKTCEVYTTDGTNAILLSAEIPNKPAEPIKRKRGRPRKVPNNDVSETRVVKSLPSTGMKILSVRPKRIRKATSSSIYCYPRNRSKRYVAGEDSDWSDNDVDDTQQNKEEPEPVNDNPNDGRTDGHTNDGHTDGHPNDGHPNDGRTDGHPNDGHTNDGHTDGHPNDSHTDGHTDGHTNDGHTDDGHTDDGHTDDGHTDGDGKAGDKENKMNIKVSIRKRRRPTTSGFTYDAGPVVCPECGVQLAYSSSLAAHMRKHTGARPFKCSYCEKAFTTKANMARHELTHTGERPYQCPLCERAFTEARSLAIHNRTHTGEKPYVCKICNASFRQRGTLQAHIYCHTGHKGHLCDLCGKAFRQKTQLREHQKRHTNSKSVKCDVCGKMFFCKGELYRHSLQHSGARPYKCSLCEKTFTRLQYLREHTNMHMGNKPYACNECEAAFYDLASLYRHKLKHKQQQQQQQQAKSREVHTVDLSEVVIVNNDAASDDVLQSLIAEAAENGQIHIGRSAGGGQAAGQSVLDVVSSSSPVSQVYQITYVDTDGRNEGTQMLSNVDFSAINLLANATQLSLGQ